MANLTPVAVTTAGAVVAYTSAAGGGDTIVAGNARNATLRVKNASGGSITVTLAGAITCSQGGLHNTAIVVAVGEAAIEVPAQCYTTAGHVAVTYSAVTSITVAVTTD